MLNKITISLLITICSFHSIAQDEKTWGADFSVSTQHQDYELVSADMQNLSLSPYFQKGNWTFSATMPWMTIDGDYFVNGSVPRIVSFCSRLEETSPLVIQRLINRGRITLEQVTRCDQLNDSLDEVEESQSGVGDIHLSAHSVWYLGSAETWWTSFGVDFKFDNGDVETGIGSGSRDTSLSVGVGYQGVQWSNHLDVSFTSVSATDSPYEIEDYSSLNAGIAYLFWERLTLGLDYQFEQAYIADGKDVRYFSIFGDWAISDTWSLRLSASEYDDVPQYPKTEYGVDLLFSF